MYKTKRCFDKPDMMQQSMKGDNFMMGSNCCCQMDPIYECPQERVVNREFCYRVPHIIPINTRIINHHVYKHFYTPCYTSCEENVCTNEYECGCQNF